MENQQFSKYIRKNYVHEGFWFCFIFSLNRIKKFV